jgi:hypothetical protein
MGRAKTPGNRTKGGKKKKPTTAVGRQAWDYGNDCVQRHRALFSAACIKGGNDAVKDQVHDGIGQLWALDFLDGHGIADDHLRDAGRLFAELWWERYSAADGTANLAPKVAKFSRASRATAQSTDRTKRDYLFEKLDDCLPRSSSERKAIIDLCVDPWFFDGVAHWANRLVTTELLRRGRLPEVVEFETSHDRDMLAAAIRGLCALVDGSLPSRYSRRLAA